VLGLDRGGSCRGRALKIAADQAELVADYLHEREMITGVYVPRWVAVTTREGPSGPPPSPPIAGTAI